MKWIAQITPQPAEQPVFHKVAENLYRLESSGGYYALVRKSGKQFRRSLKIKDRKLADRRLKELKRQIGCLTLTDDAQLGFEAVANRWLESIKHTLIYRLHAGNRRCRRNGMFHTGGEFIRTLPRPLSALMFFQHAGCGAKRRQHRNGLLKG